MAHHLSPLNTSLLDFIFKIFCIMTVIASRMIQTWDHNSYWHPPRPNYLPCFCVLLMTQSLSFGSINGRRLAWEDMLGEDFPCCTTAVVHDRKICLFFLVFWSMDRDTC